ncbi:MAG: TrkH family potassium uptake protein [Firmicutes bacterium]|nr:TrkH family potassium uptake protein [Bacillota bacterium]
MKKRKLRLSPARLIALGFFIVILVGALLLTLPFASKDGSANFLDALFTSTSATCVTGLVVRDTFTGWTTFGQLVILLLIQLGGLGFMTVITLISFALGKRLGLYDRKVLMQSAGNISLSGIGGLIRRIVPFTFVFELLGAVLLAIRFVPDFGWLRGIYFSVFHSISAFCNAGFDLMGFRTPYSSLTAYVNDPIVNLTICALIVVGGLGFLVWRDMARNKWRWSKYQLHTKLVLFTTGVLILGGWLLFFVFERDASMAGLSVPQRVLASLFQSITPRTAGFNTVDMAALSESGNLLTNVFMLIGGSPGSTAGGIKTTTVAVLILSAITSARGRSRVNAFRYSIDRDTLRQACSILMIYLIMAITAILAICALEPITLPQAMFEVNSAIATVGLSMGITASLGIASRIILILLMYAGRIGGLTFVLLFSERRTEPPVDRPNGKILIG